MSGDIRINKKTRKIIDNTFLSKCSTLELEKKFEEAYLGILTNDRTLFNPLETLPQCAHDHFAEYICYLMGDPDYLYFLMKYLLQIETWPQQALLLKQLFTHRFPLFVATRGAGKATSLDTPVLTPNGFVKMGDIKLNDLVYGRDGKTCRVTEIHPQGKKQACKITLLDGRTVECCEDHLWVALYQNKEKIITTKEIIDSGVFYPAKKFGGKVYKYKIPNCKPIDFEKSVLPIHPYILGGLLGNGCMSTATPKISSGDDFIIEEFKRLLSDFKIEVDKDTPFSYTIVDKNKDAFEFKSSLGNLYTKKSGNRLTTALRSMGVDVTCKNKFIPEIYKNSSYEDRMELVRGLLDTDGSINKFGSIEFTNTCEKLVDDLIDVLRSLGITCSKKEDKRADQEHDIRGHKCLRTPYFRVFINTSLPVFKIPRKLDRIKKNKTSGEEYVAITSAEYLDKYDDMQCISVDSPDHTYITKDYIVTHNSFSLAVYALLRMILIPETKCVITSAGFRQAKVVFDYMETIWKKSLMLQSCFKGTNNGPKHGTDVWTFRLGDSITYAIPVGPDGSKVRGYRANCVDKNTLIQTDLGLVKIESFKKFDCTEVLNINGNFETPDNFYKTEPTDVYELITENGYSVKFSKVHQIYTSAGWKKGFEITENDEIYIDFNDYFPSEYVNFNGHILDEYELFNTGLINLSTLSSPEVPWYILQSPRGVVKRYLYMLFGTRLLNSQYSSPHLSKIKQLQILLLKFGLLSKIENVNGSYKITPFKQIKEARHLEKVQSVTKLDYQDELYDFVLPETNSFIGNGIVNHNCLIADEFSSLNRKIFEEVMSGFLAVASSPVEQIKHEAKKETFKKFYIPIPKSSDDLSFVQNQLILSGTAYYKMNHFYSYFNKWKEIISADGDNKKLKALFDADEDISDINPSDYGIIRLPIELTINGYMDKAQISRIKASTTKDVFLREYNAVFSDDSEGFFKKSLIDSCTSTEGDPKERLFVPCLYGDKTKRYVFGVDPAYEGDNFAIVVIEINGNERRVVHCWTTQSSEHKQRLRDGVTKENQYFQFCARKIRNLMKHFPCEYIAMDPFGGGRAVLEALMDPTLLEEGEELLLEVVDPESAPKETDIMRGLHIIKVVNPASDWISQANYAMKKDMEDKLLRFPFSDSLSYSLAEYYDESLGDNKSMYDTLDDCIFEIDELKKELTTITVTETNNGKEKFSTPELKNNSLQKGRLKKDRYSALLLANWVARTLIPLGDDRKNPNLFDLAAFQLNKNSGKLYIGNNKIASQLERLYRGY